MPSSSKPRSADGAEMRISGSKLLLRLYGDDDNDDDDGDHDDEEDDLKNND